MSTTVRDIVERLRKEGLLAGEPGVAVLDHEITGVATDSRRVVPGGLFSAIRGVAGDGHAFVPAAESAGAAVSLVESPVAEARGPSIRVTDGRRAAAFAAAEFYGDPWKDLILIGVTGTNGKTTTVSILRHVMGKSRRAAAIGTLGVIGPDGYPLPDMPALTTPGPVEFAAAMRTLVDRGVQAVAMEVSSHALDQHRVDAAVFAAAIFTNLTRDHLDYHGTTEAYGAAKRRLAELVRRGGVLAANIDDPAWEGIGREGVHLLRFGTRGRGEVQAENIRFTPEGSEWLFYAPSCTAEVHVPLFGIYNVYNALGAATALWGLGWTADDIASALRDLPQVPGRLERVSGGATGPAIIIDYAHTPDALERALQALRPLTAGRLIVVFGAGGDRDPGKRPEMGRVAAANADFTIVTSDNPRTEDPLRIAEDIEAGMGSAPRLRVVDRREAIERAIEMAEPGDTVLLAGKGHETYQIWGDEKRPFDEREIVREILGEKGPGR